MTKEMQKIAVKHLAAERAVEQATLDALNKLHPVETTVQAFANAYTIAEPFQSSDTHKWAVVAEDQHGELVRLPFHAIQGA